MTNSELPRAAPPFSMALPRCPETVVLMRGPFFAQRQRSVRRKRETKAGEIG
jgi:hypothetical protein